MPKYKDELPAVRVYTVCDESKYLIVRNVPSLGCGDELLKLFSTYGPVEACKPMDGEDCEPYTDVYWIKFHQINNASLDVQFIYVPSMLFVDDELYACVDVNGKIKIEPKFGDRFAKRKLDESVFLGNRLQVSYAPEYESLSDTKEKLEGRRKEVLARLNPRKSKGPPASSREPSSSTAPLLKDTFNPASSLAQRQSYEAQIASSGHTSSVSLVSSDKEYFPSESMNQTVHLVREKLNKIQSSAEQIQAGSSKRARTDNRRRI